MAENNSQKQSLSNANYILVSVLITLLVLMVSGFVANILVKQAILNNKVAGKKSAANQQLKTNLEVLDNLQQQYASLGSKSQLILVSLPTKSDFPALVAMIEVIANTSGVKLKSVTPTSLIATTPSAQTSTAASPQTYHFGATFQGSYDSVLKFMGNIELSSRPVKVISFTQTGTTTLQDVEVSFETYYQGAADLSPKTEVVK